MRLDGARKDLEALDAKVRAFLSERVYVVVRDNDPETCERVLGIRVKRPPADWGRKAGHIVNDLRAALDYLVYQLALLDSKAVQSGTQFPICDTPAAFQSELKKGRLKGLCPAHVQAIEGCQPYGWDGRWLKQVRELSNPDKHRHLNTALSEHWPPVPSISGAMTLRRNKKPHRLMPEASRLGVDWPLTSQLKVEMDISTGVAFTDGAPVIETLQILELRVRQLVDAFKPEFEQTPAP